MLRCYAALLFACVPLLARAAPVPKEDAAARLLRVYGTAFDPDKDCAFEMTGEQLRIKIPAGRHTLNLGPDRWNAPRVARAVEGDFTVIVKVSFPIRPSEGPDASEDSTRFSTAGLAVWSERGESIRFVRREARIGRKMAESVVRSWDNQTGSNTYIGRFAKESESCYLRLERKGHRVKTDCSRNGKEWALASEIEDGWKGKVNVGVIAENGSEVTFEATFEEYQLTLPKK